MRSGSTLQEIKGAALDRFLLGRHGRTWNGVPLPQFGLDDVSTPAMARFRQLAQRSGRLDAETLAESDAHLLDKLRLKEGAYFKRATALLFAADPQRFVTGAFVKMDFSFFQSGRDRGLGPWGGADFCCLRSGGLAQASAPL